ncbi:hypothetical protein Q5752_000121 [Cryptotrichosporon argae]
MHLLASALAIALPLAAALHVPPAHARPERDHAGPSVDARVHDARDIGGGGTFRSGLALGRPGERGALVPRPRRHEGGLRKRANRPELVVGRGVEVAVHPHRRPGLDKRNGQGNETIVPLAESVGTYIVPVTVGMPASTYPLQLDLGSTDLLLASSLCGSSCPSPSADNPFYAYSTSFQAVDGNRTSWSATFSDGTVASGFVGRDSIRVGAAGVDGQMFGLINATNLTLSEQEISGIFGLGFPRQSLLARILLADAAASNASTTNGTSSVVSSVSLITSSGSSAASSATASTSATASAVPTYLPSFLESLVRTPEVPYPVFALALAPPPVDADSTATASSSSAAAATSTFAARYSAQTGSLTFGAVSGAYVSNDTRTGRTVADIEWWDVVPFGAPLTNSSNATSADRYGGVNDETATATATTALSTSSAAATVASSNSSATSAPASSSASAAGVRKRDDPSVVLDAFPTSTAGLDDEYYLYWALELANVSMNGTDVGLVSSYAADGVKPIALLDAGTNGIYAPQQDVERLFALVTDAREVANGVWAVPCDADMAMGFSFGGRYVQLQPSHWMYAAVADSTFCLAWPHAIGDDGTGIGWRLGTPFLRNVYTVFSYGINGEQAPLVGFLPLTDTNATSQPTSPTPTSVQASAALTATVDTTLPNYLLPSPSYATPSYAFSRAPAAGATQFIGLANSSAYSVADVEVISTAGASVAVTTSGGGGATTEEHATSGAGRAGEGAGAAGSAFAVVAAVLLAW